MAKLAILPHSGGQNTDPQWSRFQFDLCFLDAREQSTGLVTAGATRPLEGVEVRDETGREREGTREKERERGEREKAREKRD